MSLINEVLRELDKRHAPDKERTGVPNEVRPLPVAVSTKRSPFRMLVMVLLLGSILMTWWLYQQNQENVGMQPAPPVTTPVVPDAVSPAPTSAAVDRGEDVANSRPTGIATEPVPAVAGELVSEFSGLKFDTRLTLPTTTGVIPNLTEPPREPISMPAKTAVPVVAEVTKVKPATPVGGTQALSMTPRSPVASVSTTTPSAPLLTPAPVPPADDWTQAQTLLRSANPADAEPLLKKVLETQPGSVPARQALIGLLLSERRYAEAIPVLKAGLARHPDQTVWAMNLARLHVESGDYASAWEALSVGLPRAQQQADYLAFAGTVLQRLDRPAEAATNYQAALRLRPEEARWWVGLGIALESSNHPAEARAAYQRAKGIGGFSVEMGRFIDQKLQ